MMSGAFTHVMDMISHICILVDITLFNHSELSSINIAKPFC